MVCLPCLQHRRYHCTCGAWRGAAPWRTQHSAARHVPNWQILTQSRGGCGAKRSYPHQIFSKDKIFFKPKYFFGFLKTLKTSYLFNISVVTLQRRKGWSSTLSRSRMPAWGRGRTTTSPGRTRGRPPTTRRTTQPTSPGQD